MSDTKVQLDVKIFSQDFKNSCWLAGYQMLLSYEGRKHSESDIQEAFKQAGLNFKDALRYGLNESLLKSACAAVGLRTGGVLPFGTGKADQGAVKVLYKWFEHGGPLWVAGTWEGQRHINVVCGADTKYKQLCCIDPYNGLCKSEARWVNFDRYVSKIKKVKGGTQYA